MGLFGSKYNTYVGTSVSKFNDARKYLRSNKIGVVKAIARDENIPEHIMEELVAGPAFRGRKAFKYGDAGYVHGRPNDTVFAKAGSTATIGLAITNYLIGLGATSVYYTKYGVPNYYHKVYKTLHNDYSFNFITGELPTLSAAKGSTVTLHEVALLVNPASNIEDSENFSTISVYPVSLKASTEVARVGAEVVYRWVSVEIAEEVIDTPPVYALISSTTTPDYSGGSSSYTTSESTTTTTVSAPVVVVDTYIPATPPTTYAPTEVSTRTVTTTTVVTTVDTAYTVNTSESEEPSTTGTLLVVVSTVTTGSNQVTTTTTAYNQESVKTSDFSFSLEDLAKTWFMAGYLNSVGNLAFFDYVQNTEIPTLDNVLTTSYSTPGDYLPRLYFRWEFAREDADEASAAYLSSKKLAKKIGVNYKQVIEAIHEVTDDPDLPPEEQRTQADLDTLRSSLLMWSAEADSTDSVEREYLFKHFEKWHQVIGGQVSTESLNDFNTNYSRSNSFEHVLVIEDTRFKITVGMQGIWKRVVTGSIGNIDDYSSVVGTLVDNVSIDLGDGAFYTDSTTRPYHCYRKQLTATQYEEYQVVGLEVKYFVSGEHHSASGYTEDVEDARDILFVPIDYEIVKTMQIYRQEELLYKTMQIVNNSFQVVKLKWYQRGFWKTAFKVIAVVLLVMGFVEGFKLLTALATIATVSVIWALELALGYLIKMLVATMATQVFVKVAGEEFAFLAAIVATIYGMNGGKLSTQLINLGASDFMTAANAIFKEIGTQMQKNFESLVQEMDLFLEDIKAERDELTLLQESLYKPSQLAKIIVGETSTDFYNRTIHTNNAGVKMLDIPQNYVRLSLQLPKPDYYYEDTK